MAAVEVSPVRSDSDLLEFISLPWQVYRGNPYWVPPLLSERKAFLDRQRSPFFQHAKAEYFLARRGSKVVGTIAAFTNELYIVVNPNGNRLSLRRGQKVLLDAAISTGRNDTLTYLKRKWVFQTPRGIMSVIRKKKDPVWLKPDWAFLEKGESIPVWNSPLRREKGILGAFMLDLGGGVMIHGTPQEHLLGRSVTHGCVRVGYEDLKVLFDSVQVGTKVFIF